MCFTPMQLNIFAFTDTPRENKESPVLSPLESLVPSITNEESSTSTPEDLVAYEIGDIVKLNLSEEDAESELSIYLEYYYGHIKGKKGKVLQVLPDAKLQYLIEFEVKHENKQLILYHHNLEWFGK